MNMNNRQSGRRRGRNNNNNNNRQSSGGRGGMDQANRIDSRARGNGAQMIEKFRNLARDAQLAGDRVQTEYYLQFADHYFRVVSDFRQRQEERSQGQDRPNDRQRELRGVEDFDGHDDADGDNDDSDNNADSNDRRNDSRDTRSENRNDNRGDRQARDRQQGDDDNRAPRQPARAKKARSRDDDSNSDQRDDGRDNSDAATTTAPSPAPRTPRRPARAPRTPEVSEATGIDSAALPPAIGRTANGKTADTEPAGDDTSAPKARRPRRTLAKRDEGAEAAE